MLEQSNGTIRLIDWEMAQSFPLGYDLFTYIFQTNFILNPNKDILNLIQENKVLINKYFKEFKVDNWNIYLLKYCELKIEMEKIKSKSTLLLKLNELKTICKKDIKY